MESRLMAADPNPIDRSLIGTASAPYEIEVERGAILKFARAIGDANPLFADPDFARKNGWADVIAPPTFPVSFLPPEEPVWWHNLNRKRILAGEQSFRYARPVVAGDRLECRIHLVDVIDKTGRSGTMELLVQENRGTDIQTGAEVFVHRRVAVYRGVDNRIGSGQPAS